MSTAEAPAAERSDTDHLRLAELARIWRVHPATFTRYILKGVDPARTGQRIKLRATFTGGRWLVRDQDVRAFFAAVTAARTGEPTALAAEVAAAHARDRARLKRELDEIGI